MRLFNGAATLSLIAFIAMAQMAPLEAAIPPDLDAVPRNAKGFLHVEAAELWKSDFAKDLRRLIDRAGPAAWKQFARKCAPDPSTIERVTIILPGKGLTDLWPTGDPVGDSAVFIVRTRTPFDRLRVREFMGIREKAYKNRLYYFQEPLWTALAYLDDRTIMFGSEDAVLRIIDGLDQPKVGPLKTAIETAATGRHMLVLGLNRDLAKDVLVPPPLQPLLQVDCVTGTFRMNKELELDIQFDFTKAAQAAAGVKAIKVGLALARQALAEPIKQLEDQLKKEPGKVNLSSIPSNFGVVLGLGAVREFDHLLATVPVKQQDASVQLAFRYRKIEFLSPSLLMAGVSWFGLNSFSSFDSISSIEKGDPTAKHLQHLHKALEQYHADKGTYPAPAVYDAQGRPMLSWRVALLPYLGKEAKALHGKFRLDEPWDSLHNKRLIKQLPKAFRSPDRGMSSYRSDITWQWKTFDKIFVGGGAAFEPKKVLKKADLAKDTVLLMHHADRNPVFWTKPLDIRYAADRPLTDLFGEFFGQVHVLSADGKVQVITQNTGEMKLRGIISRK